MNDDDHIFLDPEARDIFLSAVEIHSSESRAVFLDEACRQDDSLRSRVEALLQSHQADSLLEPSVGGATADLTGITPVSEKPGAKIGRYNLLQQTGQNLRRAASGGTAQIESENQCAQPTLAQI